MTIEAMLIDEDVPDWAKQAVASFGESDESALDVLNTIDTLSSVLTAKYHICMAEEEL